MNPKILQTLRERFLSADAILQDYWTSEELLHAYDNTLAERIRWKIQSVVDELRARRAQINSQIKRRFRLVDLGCGTGAASDILLGADLCEIDEVLLVDRSKMARDFTRAKLQARYPSLIVHDADHWTPLEKDFVVASHVLSELSREELYRMQLKFVHAASVMLIEAGTPKISERIHLAQKAMVSGGLHIVAPCTHQSVCHLAGKNEADPPIWCHRFAYPPAWVHHDASVKQWSSALGVDVRRQAYSFLVAGRTGAWITPNADLRKADSMMRVLGLPRPHKGHVDVELCDASGVSSVAVQKRAHKDLFKSLERFERGDFADAPLISAAALGPAKDGA